MSNLMGRNDPFFLLAQDTILLLLTGDYNLNGFQKVRLIYQLTATFYGIDRCLINDICKIRTYCTGGSQSNLFQIYALIHTYILGMYLQSIYTSLQIRLVYDNSSVETTRTKKCLIQNLRSVSRRKDQDSLRRIKTIHLGKELVQGLLTLIISAIAAVSALTDCIDLIDKDDTRCIFLCLTEEVSYSGCTNTDEHLYEIRTCQGEERHMCLTCNRSGEKGLTCSRRAYKKGSLRKLGSDCGIFLRIMQEINNLLQGFLGLVLSCNILECYARFLLNVNLGITLANTHHTGSAALTLHNKVEEAPDQSDRKNNTENVVDHSCRAVRNLTGNIDIMLFQEGDQILILYPSCIITTEQLAVLVIICRCNIDLIGLNLNRSYVSALNLIQEFRVGNLLLRTDHQPAADHTHKKENYKCNQYHDHDHLAIVLVASVISILTVLAIFIVIIVILIPPVRILIWILIIHKHTLLFPILCAFSNAKAKGISIKV